MLGVMHSEGQECRRDPKGQKRPADTVAKICVAKILTGKVEEDPGADDGKDKATQSMGRRGGAARRDKLTSARRSAIARAAAKARWNR